jgi:hypothetical protein
MVRHDDYMTPRSAWEHIHAYLPKNKVIWEPFYGDGTSGAHLRDLGFQVVHEDEDFFKSDSGDYVVSNPPFSKLADVLRRLVHLQKPFMLIMPCSVLTTQYFQKFGLDVQLIVPKRRIQFTKLEDGRVVPTPGCSFDCLYYCWNMHLPKDIVFLRE